MKMLVYPRHHHDCGQLTAQYALKHSEKTNYSSQAGGKAQTGGRIIIENLNDELKCYDTFGEVKYIRRLDMVEHAFNMVRFLVNLKPAVNTRSSRSARSF